MSGLDDTGMAVKGPRLSQRTVTNLQMNRGILKRRRLNCRDYVDLI